jgi:thiol:disulfide interchange protein DsbC
MANHMYLKILIILTTVCISVNSFADQNEIDKVKESILMILPGMEIDHVEQSVIPGMYTVLIGAEVFYISKDGNFLFRGDLIDIPKKLNLSEQKRTVARKNLLELVPEKDFIQFSPDNPEHTVYIFTDVTCPYCQRLQGDIKEINEKGIAVKYLAFPRQGLDSPTATMMEQIWCSDNREEALLDAMIGLDLDDVDCASPVVEQFTLGQSLGVRGTPAIFTESGRYLPGYMPPEKLHEMLSEE